MHKNNLLTPLIFTILLVCFYSLESYSQDETSAMFRGDLQHSGYFGEQPLIDSPAVKWQFKTNSRIHSSPVIFNETLFIGSADSCLYAINLADGTLKWKFRTGGEVNSTPAINNGTIYFGSMDSLFYALDVNDGTEKWKYRTAGEQLFSKTKYCNVPGGIIKDPFDYFLSSPVIDNNVVYFGCGDGNLYALNTLSGEKVWSFKTGDVVHSSPAVYEGKIYFGSWDSFFYCVDALSGELKWKHKTGTDPTYWVMIGIQSSPAVLNDIVYFGCRDGNMYAVNADSGKVIWKCPTGGSWVLCSPAAADSVVYFGTSDNRQFIAVDALTGKRKYTNTMPGYLYSSPALTSGTIYIGSYNGSMYSVNARTGNANWAFRTEGSLKDSLDVLMPDGTIKNILKFDNEASFWNSVLSFNSVGPIVSSPVVYNGNVYFGSGDGFVYALTEGKVTDVNNQESYLPDFNLEQNYPNPFNPETNFKFSVPYTGLVKLNIYDTLGKEVAVVVNETLPAGNHNYTWNAEGLASGVYLYQLTSGNFTDTKKLVMLK